MYIVQGSILEKECVFNVVLFWSVAFINARKQVGSTSTARVGRMFEPIKLKHLVWM